jgi:HemY protein
MLRVLRYFLIVGLLVAAAVWMADRPGHVAINWEGWAIETNVGVLAITILLTVLVLFSFVRVVADLRAAPRVFSHWRNERQRRRGFTALTRGLVAVAAGHAASARKLAREADSLLVDTPLARLLVAQAAQLAGDAEMAKRGFLALLDDTETAFLALRGLISLATKEGDDTAALAWTRQAYAIRPDAAWVAETMFELEIKASQWREAQATLAESLPNSLESKKKLAALLYLRADKAKRDGDAKEALDLARRANEADLALVPAMLLLASLENERGKRNRAAEVLEEGWRVAPNPDLAKAYASLWSEETALQLVNRMERLAGFAAGHPESGLALAEAALAAQLWGQARSVLAPYVVLERPDARLLRLMSAIEVDEKGDHVAAQKWLARIGEAEPDPVWTCRECGKISHSWMARCDNCAGFACMEWLRPARMLRQIGA